MFHRSVFERCGPFDESIGFAEDCEFWLRCCLLHGCRMHLMPRNIARYRVHESQLTRARRRAGPQGRPHTVRDTRAGAARPASAVRRGRGPGNGAAPAVRQDPGGRAPRAVCMHARCRGPEGSPLVPRRAARRAVVGAPLSRAIDRGGCGMRIASARRSPPAGLFVVPRQAGYHPLWPVGIGQPLVDGKVVVDDLAADG